MKRTDTRTTALVIGALLSGWLIGASGTASSQADEVAPTPVVQGEIIKICINLKSAAIRAASKCDSKTERKTTLSGTGAQGPVGPQGEKGDTGSQGIQGVKGDTGAQGIQGAQGVKGDVGAQGLQGFTGQTGATGSVSGLRKTNITFLTADYGCPGYASAVRYVSDVTYNKYSTYTPIDVTTRSLRGCSADVYTP